MVRPLSEFLLGMGKSFRIFVHSVCRKKKLRKFRIFSEKFQIVFDLFCKIHFNEKVRNTAKSFAKYERKCLLETLSWKPLIFQDL